MTARISAIWLRAILLCGATVCLGLGLFLPIIRFDSFYFFSETPSLVELVSTLWRQGDVALALLVGLFSIVFPILKLFGIGLQIAGKAGFFGRVMPHLSRWSMMDVMLVAIVIFAAKSSGVATAVSQAGLWFYATSALIAGILPSLASFPRQARG